jgi:predicted nuclease of predicted toxin-antitoxin system
LSLRALRSDGPAIVWVRLGNTTKNTLLRVMTAALPQIVAALESGEVVVEVTGT